MSDSLHSDESEAPLDNSDAPKRPELLDDDHDSPPPKNGKQTWLVVLGCVFVLALFAGLLLPAVERVRVAGPRIVAMNNLKQMGLAMHNYHDTYGTLPPAASTDKQGKPLLSWRVAILPFIEQQNLYNEFRLDEPWDSPNNIRLLSKMPKIFAHPGDDGVASKEFKTYYRVFQGEHTAPGKRLISMRTNTIMIVEAADAVPWTKPEELEYSPTTPLPKLVGRWNKGREFMVLLADGYVQMVKIDVSERDLRAAISIDFGQNPGPEFFEK